MANSLNKGAWLSCLLLATSALAQQPPAAPHDTLTLPADAQALQELAPAPAPAPATTIVPAPVEPAPLSSAAAPPPSIQVGAVEAPTIDGVGVVDDASGKLSPQIWGNTSYETARSLLSWIHEGVAHPALHDLTLRLLMLRATPPAGTAGNHWFAERVQALINLGADDKATDMLAAVPASLITESFQQLQAELLLLKGDSNAACAIAASPTASAASDKPFWLRMNILCKALSGKKDEALLALDVMRETSATDDVFLQEAIHHFADKSRPLKTLPEHPTLLEFAIIRLAGEANRLKDKLDSLPPVAIKYLAADETLDPKLREKASGKAIQLGILPVKDANKTPQTPFATPVASDVTSLLTSFAAGNAPNSADDAVIARLAVDGSAALQDCRRIQRMLSLMEPFDYHVPPSVWAKLFARNGRYDGDIPPAPLLDRLSSAAQSGRKAEVVLLSALVLGSADVEKTHEVVLLPVIKSLLAAGFTQEAHQIANDAIQPYRTH